MIHRRRLAPEAHLERVELRLERLKLLHLCLLPATERLDLGLLPLQLLIRAPTRSRPTATVTSFTAC